MRFRLAEGVRSHSIGARPTIFVEPSQQLFEIDEVTAFLTAELSQALSAGALEESLVREGMGRSSVRSCVSKYLRFWSRQGLLKVSFDENDGALLPSEVADLAGSAICLTSYDRDLLELVRPVLPALTPQADAAFRAYCLARLGSDVCIAGPQQDALVVAPREAAPALKGLLTEDVLANLGTDTALHGALLANHSGAMFLCGSPGAGKTTLALALTQYGFQGHADDIALLRTDGTMAGVPFASAVKAHSWSLLPRLRDALQQCPIHRRLDGKRVRYLPLSNHEPSRDMTLGTIVLLNRKKRATARTIPLEPLQVLAKLVSEANNPRRRLSALQFESMLSVASGARGVELVYSELDEGALALKRFHDDG